MPIVKFSRNLHRVEGINFELETYLNIRLSEKRFALKSMCQWDPRMLLLTAMRVKRSSASVCVFVCLSVRTRTKTAETNHQTCHHESWDLATNLISGQKVKGQSYRVIKCKNIFQLKAIEWQAWVCTLSSARHLCEPFWNCLQSDDGSDKKLLKLCREIYKHSRSSVRI